MLRNAVHTGAPVGRAWPTGFSPAGSLHAAAGELLDWTLGPLGRAALDSVLGSAGVDAGEPSAVSAAALAAVLIALAAGAGAALARLRRGGGPALPPGATAPLGFAAVYALALAAALPRTDIELPPRYLAPLYAPLLVAAALILHAVLRRLAGRPPAVRVALPGGRGAAAGRAALILSACLVLWLAQWAVPAVGGVREWRERGAGYASPAWAGSDTVRELRERRPAGQIWSNEVRALYLLADVREGSRVLPPSLPDDADRWVSWAHVYHGGQDGWIVWFHSRHWLEHDYGAAELAALEGLQEAIVLEDGVVFRGDWDGGGEGSRLGGDALCGPPSAARASPPARTGTSTSTGSARSTCARTARKPTRARASSSTSRPPTPRTSPAAAAGRGSPTSTSASPITASRRTAAASPSATCRPGPPPPSRRASGCRAGPPCGGPTSARRRADRMGRAPPRGAALPPRARFGYAAARRRASAQGARRAGGGRWPRTCRAWRWGRRRASSRR